MPQIIKQIIMQRSVIYIFLISLLASCAKGRYTSTNKVYKQQVKAFSKTIRQYPIKDSFNTSSEWVGTTNFGMRKPNFVIIHHTAQISCEQTLQTFTLKRTQVSAHYVICRDGTIQHMLNDYLRAWHAGNSRWGNLTDVNSSSIGIELDNNGFEPFAEAQINSLVTLLSYLKKAHGIPIANFIGHSDIAPTRKNDPNVTFPWKELAQKGFGLWYDDTSKVSLPPEFDDLDALRIIGYDIRDSSAAIRAFKRHFEQQDSSSVIDERDKKILYNLARKYR